MIRSRFIHQLRIKKHELQRKQLISLESDQNVYQTLTYRIELINILLAEFGEFTNPKSLKNLLKMRSKLEKT